MKVTFQGFELTPPKTSSIDNLFNYIGSSAGREYHFKGYDRLLYVDQTDTHFLGLVLTVKDQRLFLELKQGEQKKLEVREVGKENSLVEFNYFTVNRSTRKGVYQHYHGSMGMLGFLEMLKTKHRQDCEARFNEAIQKQNLEDNPKEKKKLKRSFRGALKADAIVRSEKADILLAELDTIDSFGFGASIQYPHKEGFQPMVAAARGQRISVSFRSSVSKEGRIHAILSAAQTKLLTRPSVRGRDENGARQSIRLDIENLDVFEICDFDDFAKRVAPDPADLSGAWCVQHLLKLEDANADVFTLVSRN